MSIKQLPSSTIKLVTSTQTITSVSSVVKELMENALDAEALNIDVKLENNGLDRIEVKDDGSGIKKTDVQYVCLPSYTSKIRGYADLEKLHSYGFRGEALNAICHVADVTVTTRTSEDELAMVYTINSDGNIVTTKPSHFGKGTLVTVSRLFRNIPVRKNYLNSGRRAAEELKRVDNIVKCLAVIHPSLRVTFCHNKCLLWQKSACASLRLSLMQVVGHFISSKLEELVLREPELSVDMLVPRRDTENVVALCLSNVDCMMLYINRRPVRCKKLEKMILKYIAECFSGQPLTHKYPYCLVSIVVSPGEIDANLEPNKTQVLLKDEDEVLSKIENLLSSYYGVKEEMQQISNALDTAAVPQAKPPPFQPPSTQHNPGTTRGKLVSLEQKGGECKRMKVDSAVGGKAADLDAVVTQVGRERFKNSAVTELMETALHEERDLYADDSIFDSVVCNETMLATGASKVASDGGTVTRNTCTDSNKNFNSRFANSETNVCVDPCNTSVPEINPCEQSGRNVVSTHLHCNELLAVSSKEHDGVCDSPLGAAGFAVMNDGDEIVVQNTGKVRIHESSSTVTLNETGSLKSVMQDVNTCATNCKEMPVRSVPEDVSKENDRNFFFNSDFDEEIECSSSSSNTAFIPNDRSATIKNIGHTDSHKQACSTIGLVSDVSTAGIPLPGLGEHVWQDADFAVERWSKGQVKAPNGKVMQGSSLLLPKAVTASKLPEMLNSSAQSVSSQMGCKERSAFTKFARHERPKLLQEFPGIAFTKVSELLVERWRALPLEEHIRYENLAKEMDNKRKRGTSGMGGEPILNIKGFVNKSASPKTAAKQIQKRPYRREVALDISLQKLKQKDVPVHKQVSDAIPVLIGQLRPSGTWIYRKDNELGVVRHWGLQETVLYHRLMVDHSIPLKKLDTGIPVDESALGPDLWKVLLSLDKTYDVSTNAVIVTSDVISKNGFRIEILEASGRASCMLTETASTISFYGVNDLKDVLELIRKYGCSSLEKCRSQRVICYVRDEAVRKVRQCPGIMERTALQDLIRFWHLNLTHLGGICLHRKPFFCRLEDLSVLNIQKQKD